MLTLYIEKEYFGLKLEEYFYFGGYPGAIPLRKDEPRWSKYIRDSLIETVLSKDVLLMSPITKPALLRQVFGLCLVHPAEIMSYQKRYCQRFLTERGIWWRTFLTEKIIISHTKIKQPKDCKVENNIKYITLQDFFYNPYESIGI